MQVFLAMGLLKVFIFSSVVLLATFLFSCPVHCDKDDDFLQGLNSHRQSLNLPPLAKNKKAGCLANELADELEDGPCNSPQASAPLSLAAYNGKVQKCGIDVNHTTDGVVLPVCVPKLVPTLVLTNYTYSPRYARFVNDSRFTGAGVGHEDDWMVVVLTTSTPVGDFAGATFLMSSVGLGHLWATLVLGLLLVFLVH